MRAEIEMAIPAQILLNVHRDSYLCAEIDNCAQK